MDRPSHMRLFTSPANHVIKRLSKQDEWCLGLNLQNGFCKSRIDITVIARIATHSRAELSAYARKSRLSSETIPFPSITKGAMTGGRKFMVADHSTKRYTAYIRISVTVAQ